MKKNEHNTTHATATAQAHAEKAAFERMAAAHIDAITDEQQEKEYPNVTMETIEQTARAAAFVAIRKAYHGTMRKVTDEQGEILQYDGNSGGTDTMRRLYYGFSGTHAAHKATFCKAEQAYSNAIAKAAAMKGTTDEKAAIRKEAFEVYETAALEYADNTGNDTDDCIHVAALSLWENIVNNGGEEGDENAFMDAVRAVHRHMYEQDSNTSTRHRRKYDENGNLLADDEYKYIKYPHIYIDAARVDESGNLSFDIVDVNDELAKLMKAQTDNDTIVEVLAVLTTTQKRVLHYVALGYTYETIAKRMNMPVNTIKSHMHRVRAKAQTITQ